MNWKEELTAYGGPLLNDEGIPRSCTDISSAISARKDLCYVCLYGVLCDSKSEHCIDLDSCGSTFKGGARPSFWQECNSSAVQVNRSKSVGVEGWAADVSTVATSLTRITVFVFGILCTVGFVLLVLLHGFHTRDNPAASYTQAIHGSHAHHTNNSCQ